MVLTCPFSPRFGVGVLLVGTLLLGCATPIERRELAQEYFNLGNAYFELQDYERSYLYYRRAIDLSDDIPAAGFNLARLHLERSEHEAALEVLERLLERDPENALVLETRAYAFYLHGDADRARREYRGLLDRPSVRRRVAFNLGLLEMNEGRYDEAVSVLEEYLEFVEDDREYRWLLAEVYYRAGQEEEALNELEYYRSLAGVDPKPLSALAVRYVDWEYFLLALDVLDLLSPEVLREPEPAWAQAQALLRGSGEFEPGMEALERALRGGFDDGEAIHRLLPHLREDERTLLLELVAEYNVSMPGDPEDEPPDPEEEDE
ncbi:MAG: tetratricopeptide repeat protein [Spirochaetaceae bacterium]|nr:MAG: tetratricopeptide repeat protein [Spirochaetaceae bacterium]